VAAARERVAAAKRTAAIGAVVAFAVAVPLVRATNPGTSSGSASPSGTGAVSSDDGLFGSGQVAPADDGGSLSQLPQAQTGVS
jgi:hypothetical protein